VLRPVQGKTVQSRRVTLGTTYPEELAFPVLERVLKEGEKDPTRDPGEAHPTTFPLFLHFEEVQKDVHRGEDAQMPTKDLKAPDEPPAVGV